MTDSETEYEPGCHPDEFIRPKEEYIRNHTPVIKLTPKTKVRMKHLQTDLNARSMNAVLIVLLNTYDGCRAMKAEAKEVDSER